MMLNKPEHPIECPKISAHKPLRIAVDARPLRHPGTGIGKYTQKILEHLSKDTETVFYLYGATTDTPLTRIKYSKVRAIQGTKLRQTFVSTLCMGRWAHKDHVDLFWSPRHHLPLALGHYKVPGVVTIHDVGFRLFPQTLNHANLTMEKLRLPASARAASAVIVPSQSTALELSQFYPEVSDRICVIPLAGDLAYPGEQPFAPGYFLFVGGNHPRKNLSRVLKAYNVVQTRLKARCPELVVVGAALPPPTLQPGVRYAGECAEELVAALYRDSLCLVMPSLHEGFGLPVLEAGLFGKPAIISSGGALEETAGKGALTINPYSLEDLAAAMSKMIEDRALHQQLSTASKANARAFRWKKTAQETMQVFYSVFEGSNRPGR